MKNDFVRRWLTVFLFILFIFSQSLLAGPVSAQESGRISALIMQVLVRMHIKVSFDTLHHIIRKLAHFSEYLLLAILVNHASSSKPLFLNRKLCVLVFGIAIPLCDETLQRFVPGRAGMFTDCLIDMSGYACGTVLYVLMSRIRAAFAKQ